MKKIATGLAITLFSAGMAMAQSSTGQSTAGEHPSDPGTGIVHGTPAPGASKGARPGTASDKAAASGNDNQAVATTRSDADTPAKGANSFTKGEAQSRIESRGYKNVSSLRLDQNGVWRGQAEKDGKTMSVWLDYKGNIGEQM